MSWENDQDSFSQTVIPLVGKSRTSSSLPFKYNHLGPSVCYSPEQLSKREKSRIEETPRQEERHLRERQPGRSIDGNSLPVHVMEC